ncbi:hypothetical protein DMP15_29015 [Pseudonocardia sp. UM4_GMWB1]
MAGEGVGISRVSLEQRDDPVVERVGVVGDAVEEGEDLVQTGCFSPAAARVRTVGTSGGESCSPGCDARAAVSASRVRMVRAVMGR